jgi:hypothetical protein
LGGYQKWKLILTILNLDIKCKGGYLKSNIWF